MEVRIQCLYCRQGEELRIVEGAVRTGRLNPDPSHSSPLWVDKLVAEETVAGETWLGFGLCCCMRPQFVHWRQESPRGSDP